VPLANGPELGGDFADGGLPVDLLEDPVGAPPHRVLDPLRVLDVRRDREALVADVARGDRVRFVGPHGGDAVVVDVDADAAVVAAQDADGGQVFRCRRNWANGHGWVDDLFDHAFLRIAAIVRDRAV